MSKTNIIAKIKELFAEEKMAKDYTAATGEIIRCLGDSLAVGEKVIEIAAEKESPLPDGSYLLDNGKSIVVAAGEIKEINEIRSEGESNPVAMEEVVDVEMGEMKDKMEDEYKNEIDTKLVDGTEVKVKTKGDALSVGDEVLVKSGDEFVKAPAGEHELEGGLVIEVNAEGFIDELKTKEVEEEDEVENEEMKTMFEAVSTIKGMVDELKETINSLRTENTELKERFNKFAAEPSVDTITKKKENVSKLASKEDKLRFFSK
jgi:regulator of replication initiation timing